MSGDTSRDKIRCLVFTEAVTLAHVTRPLVLAQHLDRNRFHVDLACGTSYRHFLEREGFNPHSIPTISPQTFSDRLAKGNPLYSHDELEQYVNAEISLIERLSPDVVVGDFRVSLGISADFLKVPYISIANAHWSPFSTLDFPVPELPVTNILGPRLTGWIMRPLLPAIFRHHARSFNRLRKHYNLPPLADMKTMYTYGTWTLYADLPALAPTHDLPGNHQYLGPVLWSPSGTLPSWWPDVPSSKQNIYVTMGSSGDTRILSSILRYVAESPYVGLFATAGRCELQPIPGKVFVADYLPGMEAIKKSSLVICSGGSATAYQALALGVPILGLPSNADQFYTMEAIQRSGAGILLRPSKCTPASIAAAATLLLEDHQYRRHAQALADEIAACNPGKTFAALMASISCTRRVEQ